MKQEHKYRNKKVEKNTIHLLQMNLIFLKIDKAKKNIILQNTILIKMIH